jgi:hypothetical protein
MTGQIVTIRCENCDAQWSAPLADLPEDASLSQVAADFLQQHKDCADGVSIKISSQGG